MVNSRYKKYVRADTLSVRAEISRDGMVVHTGDWFIPFHAAWLVGWLLRRSHKWADKYITTLETHETQPVESQK